MKRNKRHMIVIAVALFGLLSVMAAVDSAYAELGAVGPVNPDNGFPLWYQDSAGLALGQCLETIATNRFCDLPAAGEELGFDPFKPVVFPNNFPLEFAYFFAEAFVDPFSPLRRYDVGLVGGFFREALLDGEQVAALFIRMRVDNLPVAGDYRVLHPYGEEIFPNQAAGGFIRVDPPEFIQIFPAPLDFDAPLAGDLNCLECDPATVFGPFLESADPTNKDVVDPVTGNLYLSNPVIPVTVTGSPTGNNFVRVERVELDGDGNVINVLETIAETGLFFLFGKKVSTVEVSPRTIVFPEQNVAPVFADETVTVTNMSPLRTPPFGQITVSGPDAADFTVPAGSDECSNRDLDAAESCTFVIRFSGLADGLDRTATINIPSDAGEFTAEVVSVSGTIDSVPPQVTATFPVDNGLAPANMTIIAQFDDAMDPATINGTTFTVITPGGPVAGTVTVDEVNNISLFTPSAPLAEGIVHTARILGVPAGVADSVGNPMQADFVWSFTGAPPDLTPPSIAATNPTSMSGGFPTGSPIRVTFNEPVLGFTTKTAIQVSTAAGTVGGTVTFDAQANAAVFTPSSPLEFGTGHTLTVSGGVRDLAGNALAAGFAATFVTNFRPEAPQLLSPSPGEAGVQSPVTLRWTRPVDPDGDPLVFRVSVCNNASFAGAGTDCQTDITVTASAESPKKVYYAGFGFMGMMLGLAGIILGGVRTRGRLIMPVVILFWALVIIAGMSLYSCGGSGGGGGTPATEGVSTQVTGLSSGITFFWRVEADDGKGGTAVSPVSTFSTQ